jgi:hypothetical protein
MWPISSSSRPRSTSPHTGVPRSSYPLSLLAEVALTCTDVAPPIAIRAQSEDKANWDNVVVVAHSSHDHLQKTEGKEEKNLLGYLRACHHIDKYCHPCEGRGPLTHGPHKLKKMIGNELVELNSWIFLCLRSRREQGSFGCRPRLRLYALRFEVENVTFVCLITSP